MAKINVNTATADELQKKGMIDKGKADEIVRYRDENGQFDDWDELQNVPGMDQKSIDTLKKNAAIADEEMNEFDDVEEDEGMDMDDENEEEAI